MTCTSALFTQALQDAAERARARYTTEHARIERGLALALDGHVDLLLDQHIAIVRSSDGARTYTVNGECECVDFQKAPEGRCKHRWAKAIVKRASDILRHTYYATMDTPEGQIHGIGQVQPDGTVRFTTDSGTTIVYDAGAPGLTLGASAGIADTSRAAQSDLWRNVATSPYADKTAAVAATQARMAQRRMARQGR